MRFLSYGTSSFLPQGPRYRDEHHAAPGYPQMRHHRRINFSHEAPEVGGMTLFTWPLSRITDLPLCWTEWFRSRSAAGRIIHTLLKEFDAIYGGFRLIRSVEPQHLFAAVISRVRQPM